MGEEQSDSLESTHWRNFLLTKIYYSNKSFPMSRGNDFVIFGGLHFLMLKFLNDVLQKLKSWCWSIISLRFMVGLIFNTMQNRSIHLCTMSFFWFDRSPVLDSYFRLTEKLISELLLCIDFIVSWTLKSMNHRCFVCVLGIQNLKFKSILLYIFKIFQFK